MLNIIFKRATVAEYPGILALHRDNLFSNLPDTQRQDGFLSLDMDEQQIAAANQNLAAIAAIDDGSVVGYVLGTTNNYGHQFAMLNYMMGLYPETKFRGRSLSDYRSFLYGPVCVAVGYRGTGVIQGLFQELLRHVAEKYETGVAFVAKDNPRSLYAHTQKLGMETVNSFEFKGKQYFLLAFAVPYSDWR